MSKTSVTRGTGLLEGYLSYRRTAMANSLIPASLRSGRILDIGCGSSPYFLTHTKFNEKYGIDPSLSESVDEQGMHLSRFEIQDATRLPFSDDFFDVVSMLAVIEHVESALARPLLAEVYRVLKPGGLVVLTTPCPWSDPILKAMARVHLVSPEEINDHKQTCGIPSLRKDFHEAGFNPSQIHNRYFECYLNSVVWCFK